MSVWPLHCERIEIMGAVLCQLDTLTVFVGRELKSRGQFVTVAYTSPSGLFVASELTSWGQSVTDGYTVWPLRCQRFEVTGAVCDC